MVPYSSQKWWTKTGKGCATKEPTKLQLLACFCITKPIRSTPTPTISALITIPNLPPLHLMMKSEPGMGAYRLQQNGNWSTNLGIRGKPITVSGENRDTTYVSANLHHCIPHRNICSKTVTAWKHQERLISSYALIVKYSSKLKRTTRLFQNKSFQCLLNLASRNKVTVWVLGHKNIESNEKADILVNDQHFRRTRDRIWHIKNFGTQFHNGIEDQTTLSVQFSEVVT